jgi:hypothetical protein
MARRAGTARVNDMTGVGIGVYRGVLGLPAPIVDQTDSRFSAISTKCDTCNDRFLTSYSVVINSPRIKIESQLGVPVHVGWKNRYLASIGGSRAGRSGSVEDWYPTESRPKDRDRVK